MLILNLGNIKKLYSIYLLIDFPCPDDMIKCKDGFQCIRSNGRCDYYENCNNKSDEDEDFCRGNLVFSVIIYLSHILH